MVTLGQEKARRGKASQKEESGKVQGGTMGRLKRTRIGRKVRFARLPSFHIERPSPIIYGLVSIVITVFLLAGGVFVQLEKTLLAWAPSGGQVSVAYPSLYSQTTAESYLVGSLYILGIAGLFMCFLGAKYMYKPRYSQISLLGGITLLLISFYISWDIMSAKMAGQTWPRP